MGEEASYRPGVATIKIPHITTITPGPASNGYITNIEGLLNRVKEKIERVRDNSDEKEDIKKACQLHDLGKIGIHDYILTKPDKLTEDEWKEMKSHPTKGVEILEPLHFLGEVIELIREHHERFDGNGRKILRAWKCSCGGQHRRG